jgi:iron(III) transport system permease protein
MHDQRRTAERRNCRGGGQIALAAGAERGLPDRHRTRVARPVLVVVLGSFGGSDGRDGALGLAAWCEIFTSSKTTSSIFNTLILSLRVPFGAVFAFLTAWLLVRVRIPGRRFVELSLWFGFFMPAVPIVTGWVLLLDENYGLVNHALRIAGYSGTPLFAIHSMAGIVWAHLTINTIPIMTILLMPALRQLDTALEEAAVVSGAGRAMIFRRVLLPAAGPAVLVALMAAFIKSLESFEIEQILGVPAGIDVYSTRIFDVLLTDPPDFPLAAALSTVFLMVLVVLLLLHRGLFDQRRRQARFSGHNPYRGGYHSPWLRYGGAAVLMVFVFIGIFLPFIALITGSFMRLFGFYDLPDPWTLDHWQAVITNPQFLNASHNSLVLGLVAGLLGAGLFAVIGWIFVRSSLRWRAVASFLVWLPWAIPGIVLGVVFINLTLNTPGFSLLHGTMIPVVLALLIKEMPIGVQMMRVAVGQVPESMEEAAKVAGAGRLRIFFRIVLPLVSPAAAAVFLLVFAAAIRDISTIVLIAPPNFQTLSLLMFSFANISDFEAAAVVGTIVAFVSLFLAVAANQLSARAGITR